MLSDLLSGMLRDHGCALEKHGTTTTTLHRRKVEVGERPEARQTLKENVWIVESHLTSNRTRGILQALVVRLTSLISSRHTLLPILTRTTRVNHEHRAKENKIGKLL
jgi:hypothetical protein